jgi:hypothetical protein
LKNNCGIWTVAVNQIHATKTNPDCISAEMSALGANQVLATLMASNKKANAGRDWCPQYPWCGKKLDCRKNPLALQQTRSGTRNSKRYRRTEHETEERNWDGLQPAATKIMCAGAERTSREWGERTEPGDQITGSKIRLRCQAAKNEPKKIIEPNERNKSQSMNLS